MSRRVTQAQIAAEAGVSVPTVSAVLNQRTEGIYFSDKTRDRVLATAQRLGYRANAAARQLRLGRSQVVGLAVDDLSLPFLAAVVQAAVAEFRAADHDCLLVNLRPGGDTLSALERCVRLHETNRVDAILLAGATRSMTDEDICTLMRRKIPTVLVERRLPGKKVPSVAVDNRAGGGLAMEHLLRLGRRNPAMICGPSENAMSSDRRDGARIACKNAEVSLPGERIVSGDWGFESGRIAMNQILTQTPEVDAVFAANDLMAIGAMSALRIAGRRIPEDVAVIGYDDVPLAAFSFPALSSIRQPATAMGQQAARLVLQALDQTANTEPEAVVYPELVVRASSGSTETVV